MDPDTWRRVLGDAILVRSQLDELDRKHLYPYHLPRVAATNEELTSLEVRLGRPLDPHYRAFLLMAGGWPAFYQTVDLFGPPELAGAGSASRGAELLAVAETEALLKEIGIPTASAQVVAVARDNIDVFVLVYPGSSLQGQVIWIAGDEVDRFANFDEFFVSMIEYNRRRVAKWKVSYPPQGSR